MRITKPRFVNTKRVGPKKELEIRSKMRMRRRKSGLKVGKPVISPSVSKIKRKRPVLSTQLPRRCSFSVRRSATPAPRWKSTIESKEGEPPPEGPVPPPPLRWTSVLAPKIPAVQLETIKLVAQFTALDGKGGPFLQELAVREWNNPTFGFLQPRHGHFAYFSALVDAYRHIQTPWSKPTADEDLPTDVDKCLEMAAYRAEYDRDIAERERAAQEENGGALSGASLIDWHDFVVVETIEFPVDEVVMTLPPPPAKAAALQEGENEEMEESDEEEGETIRVVPSYTPKVVSAQTIAEDSSRTHVIDPITGKSIAVADMPEHMRIQLLDPKWAEERKKFMEKQKDSNLVAGDVIASNISRFAQARGDLFGSTTGDLSSEADSRKRLDEANRVIREQAQQPLPGPSLPELKRPAPFSVASPMGDAIMPPEKRPRLEGDVPLPPPPAGVLPPPPLPPITPQGLPPEGLLPQEQQPSPAPPETKELLSESEFAASLDSPTVKLSVQIPQDPSNAKWNFNGQVVSLSVDVMSKIKTIKTELQGELGGMPVNKMQLKVENAGFLKDGMTLARLNLGPSASLELIPKIRGGRK